SIADSSSSAAEHPSSAGRRRLSSQKKTPMSRSKFSTPPSPHPFDGGSVHTYVPGAATIAGHFCVCSFPQKNPLRTSINWPTIYTTKLIKKETNFYVNPNQGRNKRSLSCCV